MAHAILLQGSQFSTLHLQLITLWQTVLLCSGDVGAHHHAYGKPRCLIHSEAVYPLFTSTLQDGLLSPRTWLNRAHK